MKVLEQSDSNPYNYDTGFIQYVFRKLTEAENLEDVDWSTEVVPHLTVEEFMGAFMAALQLNYEIVKETPMPPKERKSLSYDLPESMREPALYGDTLFSRIVEKEVEE